MGFCPHQEIKERKADIYLLKNCEILSRSYCRLVFPQVLPFLTATRYPKNRQQILSGLDMLLLAGYIITGEMRSLLFSFDKMIKKSYNKRKSRGGGESL